MTSESKTGQFPHPQPKHSPSPCEKVRVEGAERLDGIRRNNSNATATISGNPEDGGTYRLTIKTTFGSGSSKYVVSQAFTLTVDNQAGGHAKTDALPCSRKHRGWSYIVLCAGRMRST